MSDDLERGLKDVLAERGRLEPGAVERMLDGIDTLPPRPARFPRSVAVAAGLMVAVVGLALVTLLRPVTDVTAPPSAVPSASEPSRTPGPTLQPPPVWAVDLALHLDCDGPPSSLGMETDPDPVPFDPWRTPEEAFAAYLAGYLRTDRSLPPSGYTPPLVDGRWALQRYLVDGRPKVHAVATNQFPDAPAETRWQVVGLRACDPSEIVPRTGDPS
jgi:hypothetical protein